MAGSQYLMWMRRKQILTSVPQLLQAAPIGDGYNSWEERAFAEDAARILGAAGSMWPPRSYTCNFCKREFRSAQALGGHMNIHRRDRARLKQNLSPHNNDHDATLDHHHHHQKNDDFKQYSSLGNHHFSGEIIDCSLKPYSSPATTVTTNRTISPSRLSVSTILSPHDSSSSTIWGVQKMGSSPNSEPAGGVLVNARKEDNFKELGCNTNNHDVETSLSVGLTSMFGQKSLTFPCGDNKAIMSCKRLKTTTTTTTISSVLPPPVFFKPCNSKDSNRCLALQPAEIAIGVNNPGMEDLDLELRLGKQQKVN